MSKSVEDVVNLIGEYVNGQIVMTWNTRQTAEQFLEIREQGGVDDDPEFTIEEFIEYVKSNTADVVIQLSESKREEDLLEVISVVNQYGEVVEDE
jgi:hypothetical protein